MSSYALPWKLLSRFGWQSGIEADFSRGLVRDVPRSSVPVGGVYDSTDYILRDAGRAFKRGGVSYFGDAMGGAGANLNGSKFITIARFAEGSFVLCQANDLHLYDLTSGAADLGALSGQWPRGPAVMFDNRLWIAPDGDFKKVSYSAGPVLASPTNGPPQMRSVTTYAGRLVVANDRTNSRTNRIYFGPAPDPEAVWDTANSYIDANNEISHIEGIQGALLVFSHDAIERIIGEIPPGHDGEDMALQPFAPNMGAIEGTCIGYWGPWIIFAGAAGVFMTNGSTVEPLMSKDDGTGILSYYQGIAATAIDTSDYVFSGGVLNSSYYHLVISSGTGAVVYAHLVCYLPHRTWWRLGTNDALCWQSQIPSGRELYAALGRGPVTNIGNRAVAISGIYTPSSANKQDPDGSDIEPMLETRVLGEGVGVKAYGHAHLHYDMRGDEAPPSVTVSGAKFDGSAGDSIAWKSIGAHAAFAIEQDLVIPTTVLEALHALNDYTAYTLGVGDNAALPAIYEGLDAGPYNVISDPMDWVAFHNPSDSGAEAPGNTQVTLRLEMTNTGADVWTVTWKVDGVTVITYSHDYAGQSISATTVQAIVIGAKQANSQPGEAYYVVAVRAYNAATGGALIFSDDFTVSTDFSSWDGHSGTCSIVVDEVLSGGAGGCSMGIEVAPGIEAPTFHAVPESPLPPVTNMTRRRFRINRDSQGMTVRLTQSGSSDSTEIFGIEYEARTLPLSAEGQ